MSVLLSAVTYRRGLFSEGVGFGLKGTIAVGIVSAWIPRHHGLHCCDCCCEHPLIFHTDIDSKFFLSVLSFFWFYSCALRVEAWLSRTLLVLALHVSAPFHTSARLLFRCLRQQKVVDANVFSWNPYSVKRFLRPTKCCRRHRCFCRCCSWDCYCYGFCYRYRGDTLDFCMRMRLVAFEITTIVCEIARVPVLHPGMITGHSVYSAIPTLRGLWFLLPMPCTLIHEPDFLNCIRLLHGSRVTSRIAIVITHVTGRIAPRITTGEPPHTQGNNADLKSEFQQQRARSRFSVSVSGW